MPMKRLSQVLTRRMAELGLNYEELARQMEVSSVYISRIVQGKVVPSDDVIFKLCRALDLDLDRLVLLAHYEKAPDQVKPVFARLGRHSPAEFLGPVRAFDNVEVEAIGAGAPVPVVGLVQAGDFMPGEDGGFPAGAADAFVYTDQQARNLFAVRVVNDSMEPDFREGDVLIVNPNLEAKNGDFVIAKLRADNEVTFKKLVRHDRIIILRPLNSRYQDIVLQDPDEVELVGKVVERKTLY
jgi:SOS-response transcriptional repressor LexA